MHPVLLRSALLLASVVLARNAAAEDARFFRGVVVNGPALTIDGNAWDGKDAKDFSSTGKTFENQTVTLKPATDTARARMIRASRWGDNVDLTFANVPPGACQVFLYVWEDTLSEQFKLLVNDRVVVEEFHSGSTGMWKKLGPWPAERAGGTIKISARGPSHGAANLSGVEIWSGTGAIPTVRGAEFVSAPTPEQVAFLKVKSAPCSSRNAPNATARKRRRSKAG